jgi:hypothetical protein
MIHLRHQPNIWRFQLKSLLWAITIAAIWLSTLAGYTGSEDVQSFIWMAIVIMSGVAAAGAGGARRAFWVGFFSSMLFTSMRETTSIYQLKFHWTVGLASKIGEWCLGDGGASGQQIMRINTTIVFLTLLIFAMVIGRLSMAVHYHFTCKNHDA